MGVFDNMKSKLGFGGQTEWQDEPYQDDYSQQDFIDEPLDDNQPYEESYTDSGQSSVLSFDTYNPSNFGNVTLKTDRDIKVASYGDDTTDSYFGRRQSYGSNIGTSSYRNDVSSNVRSFSDRGRSSGTGSQAAWDTPSDPAFLDAPSLGSSARSTSASEVLNGSRSKPADHVAIIKVKAYADVEHVAAAARTGKVVALPLKGVRPELAKRVLDFSFGVASALNGSVDKAADKVYIISRDSKGLTDEENAYLREQGII